MPIITIARQYSSLGDEIGKELSRLTGYKIINKNTLRSKIIEQGFPEKEIDKFDGVRPNVFATLSKYFDSYLYHLRTAIFQECKDTNGNCIIIGRGSFAILKDIKNHIPIRCVESIASRASRIEKENNISDKHAKKEILKKDLHQIGFYRSFFKLESSDFYLFDLQVNTENCSPLIAAKTIIAYANAKITPEDEKIAIQQIEKALLGQNIAKILTDIYGLNIDKLKVVVEDDTIILDGVVDYSAVIDRAITIIKTEIPNFSIISRIRAVQDSMAKRYS